MYGRRPKESHRDTVTYEIDMLDFCIMRLTDRPKSWDQPDEYAYIETFLLHYRNLIRFFSGKNHHRTNEAEDLSTANPAVWAGRPLTEAEINAIRKPAEALDDAHLFIDISQYIQHCTDRRAREDRGWDAVQMYQEIDPIISEFERFFPRPPERPRHKCNVLQVSNVTTFTTQSLSPSPRGH